MRKTVGGILLRHAVLFLFCLVAVVPILYMVTTSCKSISEILSAPLATFFPVQATTEAYHHVWNDYPFLTYLKNSVVVVLTSTVVAVVFSTLAGYGFSRFSFRSKGVLMLFILTTQMFPSVMLYVPYYKLLSVYKLTNTYTGLILVYVASVIPFCSWMMYGFFEAISRELDEAALIDGCGRLRTFLKIVMPLTLPGLISTTIYAFVQGWNEYMFAMIFTNAEAMKTLPVAIGQMSKSYKVMWNDLMAASLLASVPLIVLFVFLQRYFISGMTSGAVKG